MSTRVRPRTLDTALWLGSGVLFVGVVIFSVTPQPAPVNVTPVDKLEHALMYGSLTGCLLLAAVWRPGRGRGVLPDGALPIAGAALLLGIVLELVQAFGPVSGRTGDPLDALADAVGIAAVLAVWNSVRRRRSDAAT